MPTIQDIAKEIVAREGGFVNDPDDPGGATQFGVTLGTMRRLGLDLDGNGRISVNDVKKLTRKDAEEIFISHYFETPGIGRLPAAVQASVFDMYVNAGSNAVRILQRLMGAFGYEVVVDGVIGAITSRRAHQVFEVAPVHFADAYGIARRNYYYKLADRRVSSRKYARRKDGGKGGWILRAEEFISPKYHLSGQDHQGRVSKWA